MKFFHQIKPKNTAEWSIIALVIVLAAATAVLALTRQLVPAEENNPVKLQAMTSVETEKSISPTLTAAAATNAPEPAKLSETPRQNQALLSLEAYGGSLKEMNDKGLKPLLDQMVSQYNEEVNDSRLLTLPEVPAADESAPQYAEYSEELQEESSQETTAGAPPSTVPSQTTAYVHGYVDPRSQISYEYAPTGTLNQAEFGQNQAATDPYAEATYPDPNATEALAEIPYATEAQTASPYAETAPEQAQAYAYNDIDPAAAPQVASEVFSYINSARASAGLSPLGWDPTLSAISNQRAAELSVLYDPGHSRPDGSFSLTWITNTYGANYAEGENIGWFEGPGRFSGSYIYNSFANSGKGHLQIMMDPNATIGAVSLYCVGNKFYVCMNFGY